MKYLTFSHDGLQLRKLNQWYCLAWVGRYQEDNFEKMQWNRSNTIGLSRQSCTLCHGQGVRIIRKATEVPCNCVFRSIFRACYNRFRECESLGERISPVSLEFCHGVQGGRTYSRKREEYICDFDLVSRRALHGVEQKLFRFHFLLGADWKLCCRQLKIERGEFFHILYRIEEKLGRVFAELRPYPLYPLDDYFGGNVRRRDPAPALTLNQVFDGFDERASRLRLTA